MDLTKITDHIEIAQGNLFSFFNASPKLRELVAIIVAEIQALENVGYDLIVKRYLVNAEGVQLDVIGLIVGEQRIGLSDDDYRALLYIVIAINHSNGGAADITNAAANLLGVRVRYRRQGRAAFHLEYLRATGQNLAIDGTMEAVGTAAYTGENTPTLSKTAGGPGAGLQSLRIAYLATADPGASQDILTLGEEVRAAVWFLSDGTAIPRLLNGSTVIWTGTADPIWQLCDETFTPGVSTKIILQGQIAAAGYVEADNLIVVPPADFEWLERVNRLLRIATMGGVQWEMVEGHTTKPFRFGGSAGSGWGDGHLGRHTGDFT